MLPLSGKALKASVSAIQKHLHKTFPATTAPTIADLASVAQDALRETSNVNSFSLLNPSGSYSSVMNLVWQVIVCMRQIMPALPLTALVAVQSIHSESMQEVYALGSFQILDNFEVDDIKSLSIRSNTVANLGYEKQRLLCLMLLDKDVSKDKKINIFAEITRHPQMKMSHGTLAALQAKYK